MAWGTIPWYDAAESTLNSWLQPITHTFQGGIVPGIETVTSASWLFMQTHPLLSISAALIGTGVLIAYRRRGVGIGLGRVSVSAENFLGHFHADAGFGPSPKSQLKEIKQNLTTVMTKLNMTAAQAAINQQTNSQNNLTLLNAFTENQRATQGELRKLTAAAAATQEGVAELVKHRRTKST
ncbi:hypothetical protein [Candidatus Berkiella aquae]|uniref:Uncharacterized protein n=1 Tax=Candidatus Berkiella aquae TaxID=295108 RepID=A0A0Q9YDN8_9GAMM|nr:hypothetical protein [Candidatus Berkiella aquae]MCS5709957.1 hypothetical protein [Candidatus Berkiella aquae]